MERENIPIPEYEKLADTWQPKPRPMREWARLARQAGMHYMVMTTKHCDGYCLWDTQQTDYNSVRRSPGRDLVREYVEACREYGLKIGFYHVLMDWHHPDARLCHKDEGARRRYVDYVRGCVRELMSNYGPIDILWWDAAWPMQTAAKWESVETNAMVRALQPNILINNRHELAEDFDTPEGHLTPSKPGRMWESFMTFDDTGGYMPSAVDWRSVREVLEMLRTVAAGQGNLALNIGPTADGSVPPKAVRRLQAAGRWLARNGEAVYGPVDRVQRLEWMPTGHWTLKGNTAYYWVRRWPGKEITIGGLKPTPRRVTYLATGEPVAFTQRDNRVLLYDLPEASPDGIAGVCVFKLEFDAPPYQDREYY